MVTEVMGHEKLAQSYGLCVISHGCFVKCAPRCFVVVADIKKISLGTESPDFPTFLAKCHECKI